MYQKYFYDIHFLNYISMHLIFIMYLSWTLNFDIIKDL